jgi:hypothetical protein
MKDPIRPLGTRETDGTALSDRGDIVWMATLSLAGIGGTVVISCIAPFVALAVVLAGTVKQRRALLVMGLIWLTNQLIGFTFFHFPRTANTILWGLVIGAAALLSTSVASLVLNRPPRLPIFVRLTLAFVVGFVSYQGCLVLSALVLGGAETFAPSIIFQIALTNVVWLAGLIVLNELMSILAGPLAGRVPRLVKT